MNKLSKLSNWLYSNHLFDYANRIISLSSPNEGKVAQKLNYKFVSDKLKTQDHEQIMQALENDEGFFSKEQMNQIRSKSLDFITTPDYNPTFAMLPEERAWMVILSLFVTEIPSMVTDYISANKFGGGKLFKTMKSQGWNLDWYSKDSYREGLSVLNKLQEKWHKSLEAKHKSKEQGQETFKNYNVFFSYDGFDIIYVPSTSDSNTELYKNIPNTSHDRIVLGNKLGLCLGSTSKLYQDNSYGKIYALCKDKNPLAAIRINDSQLEESRAKNNSNLPLELAIPTIEFIEQFAVEKIKKNCGLLTNENINYIKENKPKTLDLLIDKKLLPIMSANINSMKDFKEVEAFIEKTNQGEITEYLPFVNSISQDVIKEVMALDLSIYKSITQYLVNPEPELVVQISKLKDGAYLGYLDTRYLQNNYLTTEQQLEVIREKPVFVTDINNVKPEVKALVLNADTATNKSLTRELAEQGKLTFEEVLSVIKDNPRVSEKLDYTKYSHEEIKVLLAKHPDPNKVLVKAQQVKEFSEHFYYDILEINPILVLSSPIKTPEAIRKAIDIDPKIVILNDYMHTQEYLVQAVKKEPDVYNKIAKKITEESFKQIMDYLIANKNDYELSNLAYFIATTVYATPIYTKKYIDQMQAHLKDSFWLQPEIK